MKRRGVKKKKGCVEVVAVKSVVAVGSGWRLCLMWAEEWLAVYVWAIEREEVGRKMEDGKENSVATTEASNARTHHPSRPKQSPAGHETPVFQEQGPHPNTPATSYPFQMKSIQVYSPHKAQVFACTRPSSLSDVVEFRKYSLQ